MHTNTNLHIHIQKYFLPKSKAQIREQNFIQSKIHSKKSKQPHTEKIPYNITHTQINIQKTLTKTQTNSQTKSQTHPISIKQIHKDRAECIQNHKHICTHTHQMSHIYTQKNKNTKTDIHTHSQTNKITKTQSHKH